jgi:hypothetical protein
VTLEPLRDNHVSQIYEAYMRHDHPVSPKPTPQKTQHLPDCPFCSTTAFPFLLPLGVWQACRAAQNIDELAATGAFETVAKLTGGVPRQIHHMLAALILSGTKLQPATVELRIFLKQTNKQKTTTSNVADLVP